MEHYGKGLAVILGADKEIWNLVVLKEQVSKQMI